MTFEPKLRTDILSKELSTEPDRIKVIVETQFNDIVRNAELDQRTKSSGAAKNIVEAMELFGQVIEAYDERTNKNADARVFFTYEKPDKESQLEAISVRLIDREPGLLSQSNLKERNQPGRARNLRPILRELVDDPDNPGYKRAILGYLYDNTVRFTCWARTNKAALARMMWLEEVMEQYLWYFKLSGINRTLYDGRGEDEVLDIKGNKIYGVSLDYFVRTENIRAISQKTLEYIVVKIGTTTI